MPESVVVRVPESVWKGAKFVGAMMVPPLKPAEVLREAVEEFTPDDE
jgi:hypothetical protein